METHPTTRGLPKINGWNFLRTFCSQTLVVSAATIALRQAAGAFPRPRGGATGPAPGRLGSWHWARAALSPALCARLPAAANGEGRCLTAWRRRSQDPIGACPLGHGGTGVSASKSPATPPSLHSSPPVVLSATRTAVISKEVNKREKERERVGFPPESS